MRALIFLAVAIVAPAHAGQPECTPRTLLESYADDGSVSASIPWQPKYNSAPSWDIEHTEPPLPVAAAIKAALEWARNKANHDVHIWSVGVWSAGCLDKWAYVIHFLPPGDGAQGQEPDVAMVLMDGTVVGKAPAKR